MSPRFRRLKTRVGDWRVLAASTIAVLAFAVLLMAGAYVQLQGQLEERISSAGAGNLDQIEDLREDVAGLREDKAALAALVGAQEEAIVRLEGLLRALGQDPGPRTMPPAATSTSAPADRPAAAPAPRSTTPSEETPVQPAPPAAPAPAPAPRPAPSSEPSPPSQPGGVVGAVCQITPLLC